MSRLSIRARLAIAFALAVIMVLALAALFVFHRVSNELTTSLDNGLRSRADDLAALVSAGDLSGQAGDLNPGDRLFGSEEGFAQVVGTDGKLRSATPEASVSSVLSADEAQSAADGPLTIDSRAAPGVEGDARILARPAGHGLIVVTAASTDDRDEALAGLNRAFAFGAPIALALSLGLGYLLAGGSLAPVAAMRRGAARISLERSGERLPLPRADDEIRQLGTTLNEMLDRIETSLERERVFVSDAAHELRTPLANLRTELELAGRPGRDAVELRAALISATDEVERLSQLSEDLLVIARSDRGTLPVAREPVDLKVIAERVAARFERRAAQEGRPISIEAEAGQSAALDPLRIEQALGNLLDNALRHGDGSIALRARNHEQGTIFEVSDQGRGFPEEFADQAFERFTRADGGRTGPGAGLGLSIVQAIAAAHGGTASIEPTENGATVRITLPAGL